jgi:hypothetical protein
MPRGVPKETPESLAQKTQEALDELFYAGYVEQVETIRKFLRWQADEYDRRRRTQREIASVLSRKLREREKADALVE